MRARGKKTVRMLALAALLVVVSCWVAVSLRHAKYDVPTRAMEPTIPLGSRVSVERFDRVVDGSLRYCDIVVFESPREPGVQYVQRVIGLPGDTLAVRSKRLYRNEASITEAYVKHERQTTFAPGHEYSCLDEMQPVTVPPGHVFLMGDNRDSVIDSRYWGPVPYASISGRVVDIDKPE